MSNFTLTCCSTADMDQAYFQQRNIPYVCFHYNLEGQDYADDLGKTIPYDEFYSRISAGALPTTSQVNVGEFIEFFEPLLQAGQDILHLSFSSGLSGSFQSANLAKAELEEKYPDRQIRVIDSLGASSGYGLLVDAAADQRDAGKPLDEVAAWVEDARLHLHHWFFSSDLTHFIRGGRISAPAGAVGKLLNICPLMNMDDTGHLRQRQKIKGKKKVIKEIVNKMKEHAQGGEQYSGKCFLSHSACPEDARQVADLVEQTFPQLDGKVQLYSVGTVIGSHTGPGTVALFFFGDRRTD